MDKMQCVMDHIVLNMTDEDKMIAFYADILMLETERLAEYRSGKVPFPSVRMNGDFVIDLFPKQMWQAHSPAGPGHDNLNHFCFALDKPAWDKLINRLEENRVPIDEGPVSRWGAHGTGISVYFRDPENNTIEARYYADKDPLGKVPAGVHSKTPGG